MAGIPTLKSEAVKYLVVHCSATPPTSDIGAADIDRWHRARGWLKIGYHFVIRRDGTLETGRKLTEVGSHVAGWNHCSLGICLAGGVDTSKLMKPQDNFTEDQKGSLKKLLTTLQKTGYAFAEVRGHRDFPDVAKACPSFDAKAWWALVGR